MEERTLRKFNFAEEVKGEIDKKIAFRVLLIPVAILWIGYYADKLANLNSWQNEDKFSCYFCIALGVMMIIAAFYENKRFSDIQGNLMKNTLEIKDTYISGIYTENPKTSDNDKYFKIEYNQIERLEVKDSNVKSGEYHNLYIYYTGGLVKLAIESPKEACSLIDASCHQRDPGNIIYQPYACPCGNTVHYGDAECPQCGRKFDWTKL